MIVKRYRNGRLISEEIKTEDPVRRKPRRSKLPDTPTMPKSDPTVKRTATPVNRKPKRRKLGGCGCGKKKRR
jgi:hypothetical protein